MSHDVLLTVSGQRYGGWQSIRISRGMGQIAGTFDLTVTERWPEAPATRAIRPGEACTVTVDGEVVITGYVDDVEPRYDAADHTVTIRGRDRTGDLVDCSAEHAAGEWQGARLAVIARDVCAPFGISVAAAVDTGEPFATFGVQPGETAFELLDRAARMRGLLPLSDGRGGLVLTRAAAGAAVARLELGKNILEASGTFSLRDRFSRYTVKGQAEGGDFTAPTDAAEPAAVAGDEGVTRHRPLILVAEDQGTRFTLAERAAWERNTRWGRGTRVQVLVQAWEHADGVWAPNTLARVVDPWLGVDADLLIDQVTHVLDERGSRTELGLTRREAYLPGEPPAPKDAGDWL